MFHPPLAPSAPLMVLLTCNASACIEHESNMNLLGTHVGCCIHQQHALAWVPCCAPHLATSLGQRRRFVTRSEAPQRAFTGGEVVRIAGQEG